MLPNISRADLRNLRKKNSGMGSPQTPAAAGYCLSNIDIVGSCPQQQDWIHDDISASNPEPVPKSPAPTPRAICSSMASSFETRRRRRSSG
jgi:hypothetical protein